MKGVKLRAAILAAGTLFSAPGWSVMPTPHFEHRAVVFAEGSASLSRQMQGAIQSLAPQIGDVPVTIVGRDDEGAASPQLAQARAKMISAALRAAGVARSNMLLTVEHRQASLASQRPDSQISWTPQAQHTSAHPGPKERQSALQPGASSLPLALGRATPASDKPFVEIIPVAPIAALAGGQTEPPVMHWEVKTSDVTLLRTLERWALDAGYKLKWDAAKNFLIGASDIYTGSFEDALQAVLSSAGIRLSDYPLEACIYSNTPPLVRITRQGDQVRECGALNATAP